MLEGVINDSENRILHDILLNGLDLNEKENVEYDEDVIEIEKIMKCLKTPPVNENPCERLNIKWIMIASIYEFSSNLQKELSELLDFCKWLISSLETNAYRHGQTVFFDYCPKKVYVTNPYDEDRIEEVYNQIHEEYPDVLYVLHVIPENASESFELVKKLGQYYQIIVQEFRLETIMKNEIERMDINEFFGRLLVFLIQNLHDIVRSRKTKITISSDGVHPISDDHSDINVQDDLTRFVLHSPLLKINSAMIKVSGYPTHFNQFDIAKLFTDFQIISIMISYDYAFVNLGNKFQAAQAVININKKDWCEEEWEYNVQAEALYPEVASFVEKVTNCDQNAPPIPALLKHGRQDIHYLIKGGRKENSTRKKSGHNRDDKV